jgi:murein L,D-transpeptidase YcbB/YkuD
MVRTTVAGTALAVVLTACGVAGERAVPSGTAVDAAAPDGGRQPGAPAAPVPLPEDLVGVALQRLGTPGESGYARTAIERAQLDTLYATSPVALWLDAEGQPTTDAEDALALLASSDAHGLRPEDYQSSTLARLAHRLDAPDAPAEARVRFDITLSLHVLRYWRDLHLGRVDPRTLGFRLDAPVDDHDFPAMLRGALAAHRLGAVTDELAPPLVLYRSLVTALSRYREIAPDAQPVTLPTPKRSFKPGERIDGLESLRALLVLVGDLPPDAAAAGDVYDGALVEGVKQFQARHGLDPDGVLGRSTLAAVRVPLSVRVQQLELALERLRWLPHLDEEGFLAVNIPMFRLWGWGRMPPDGSPAFDMGVIVGRALDTQTPIFVEEMRHIIFRPYWNVPPSILRGETLPAIVKDPSYLARNDMEIVSGQGDDGTVVPLSEESVALLRQGRLRVRQRPGPKNSLGLVKFVFPNDDNIFMHGTPVPQLFGRARRDFSHGCVRLEDPLALAEWVLRDQPEWTRDRIVAAMASDTPQQVNLTRPIQVLLFYLTAVVLPANGAVHFAEDIYGHDRKLAHALTRAITG